MIDLKGHHEYACPFRRGDRHLIRQARTYKVATAGFVILSSQFPRWCCQDCTSETSMILLGIVVAIRTQLKLQCEYLLVDFEVEVRWVSHIIENVNDSFRRIGDNQFANHIGYRESEAEKDSSYMHASMIALARQKSRLSYGTLRTRISGRTAESVDHPPSK